MTEPEKISVSIQPTWEWEVFGNDNLTCNFFEYQKPPTLRVRILSRLILGSKWRKIKS